MSNKKNDFSAFIFSVFAIVSLGVLSNRAFANANQLLDPIAIIESSCASGQKIYPELIELRNEIATSKTINKAKEKALASTDIAIVALKNARTLLPFSEDLQFAETRLTNARSRILVAASQEQVADEFSGILVAGLDDDRVASIKAGKVGCNYSTGEVIAIVVGFILGIIPGLILLVVLC